ncbi:HlyD family efflux transporter periplasmic adaptor subunit [Uliginosibacterium paludis]|uniref:HlyD family efflux transporter periplasmic adaptor subunit n=1 Tax=Uliginosibacterium paludis TaxID=1615952 RepID=A0ABV2CT57_9RHOO
MSAAVMLPDSLPALREDLQLHQAARHADGSPGWVIQDPVSNQFYRIGWLEFELLSRWSLGDPLSVLQQTAQQTLLVPSAEELETLLTFLAENQLLAIHDPRHTLALLQRARLMKAGGLRWLLHHYLFFRIPLIRPARFLSWLATRLEGLFTPVFLLVLGGLGLVGLMLIARQWDVFQASLRESFSPAGLLAYLVALALTKSLHELGHAVVATRFGLRVGHMGVAFVVMWPMLYTDTGEAWKLDHRKRLAVSAAGILTEFALAVLATFAWNFAAPGALREALFFLATTAWVTSLLLNLSPFMRFDGYFILSDLLDMPNLHERAFSLARSALRRLVLGSSEPDAEHFPPLQRRLLIGFALTTWLYRLSVFMAIALAVYAYFFKLLGIMLFAVEVAWFIVLPIWRELRQWGASRARWSHARRSVLITLLLAPMLLLMLPLPRPVSAPAWVHPARIHNVYTPLAGRLVSLPQEGAVAAGQVLFELVQPELDFRAETAATRSAALASQLRGLAAQEQGESRRAALGQQKALQDAELQAQQAEAARLLLRAPFAGRLVELDPLLAPGGWVGPKTPLALLISSEEWQGELFVSQTDLARVAPGARVRLYPERDALRPLTGRVLGIDGGRVAKLPAQALSAHQGGPVAVTADADGMTPRDALYRVRVALDAPPGSLHFLRASARIEAPPESWLLSALKTVLVVLVRELSF